MTKISYFFIIAASSFFLIDSTGAKKIPRWWLKVAQKQGPNACVVEEVPETNREFWTECRYWLNRHICGQKTRIRFECCEGFDQIDGEDGCALVKPLKNILETAESLGATKWTHYIRQSGLEDEFESSGAYTMFVPTNEAFEAITGSLRSQLDSYRGSPNNPIIYYHIVPSKLRSGDFEGDQTIETKHQGHKIRINKYSNGMTTINCALLLRKDQEASNGIVHLIDGFLDPSDGISSNVGEIILEDGRFQVLALMLEKSGYINLLRTMQNSITILAPSDEAFQKLPDSRREKIINDKEARLAILQNHVIPHVICESAITGEHKVRTMYNNRLTFNCDVIGAYVEATKMTGNFNLGKNGIVHLIDDVLLPDRAKNLIELAESRNLDTFVQLVKRSGLEETLSHTGDYTFFVPDETAWHEMPPETLAKIHRDPEFAGLMLRYHGAYGRHLTNAITDNQAFMSLDEENPIRLQVWRKALGVEDAKITEPDIEAQNGVIHIINKVIFPSNKSIREALNSVDGHTFYTFLNMLNRVTSEPGSSINLQPENNQYYTFFIPTDRAFTYLDQSEVNNILADRNKMKMLIEDHVAVNMFPKISFEPGLTYSIDGIGTNFIIKKSHSGDMTVNGKKILGSQMSINGVIYVIDNVFYPSSDSSYNSTAKRTYATSSSTHSTRHSTTTLNEGYNKYLDDILPVFPKGSVIAGSEKRRTYYALPQSHKKTTRRRGKRLRVKSKLSKNSPQLPTNNSSKDQFYYKAHESQVETVVRKTTITPETTKPNLNVSSNIDVNEHAKVGKLKAITLKESDELEQPIYNNFDKDRKFSNGQYNYSGTIYAYPAKLSGSRYDTYFANKSSSHFPRTFGFAYNYSWPGSSYNSKNSSRYNLTLPLPWAGYNYSHSSSSYSASAYLSNGINIPPLVGSQSHLNFKNKSVQSFNTVGPVSPSDAKFSYVGHPYGKDVVGHDSRFLPYSSAGPSYVSRNGSSGDNTQRQGENHTELSPILNRKRVYKTHTIYTYPSGKSSKYLTKSTRIFTHPDGEKKLIVTTDRNKTHPRFVSAYAFTGDEDNFADGTEFSEAKSPSEELITGEQAKILRRQWRKKKHNRRRSRNRRRRRRMRNHHRNNRN